MMKQSEAVIAAVKSVCGEQESYTLTKEQKESVKQILFEGFSTGEVSLKKSYTETKLKKYINGLIDNHVRKSKVLNGGVKYEIKNPGSRSGRSDAKVANLVALLDLATSDEDKAEILSEIAARKNEISANKKPTKKSATINYDVLPEHIRVKFQK